MADYQLPAETVTEDANVAAAVADDVIIANKDEDIKDLLLLIFKELKAMRLAIVSMAVDGGGCKDSDFDPEI